jgi:hypothetical protein
VLAVVGLLVSPLGAVLDVDVRARSERRVSDQRAALEEPMTERTETEFMPGATVAVENSRGRTEASYDAMITWQEGQPSSRPLVLHIGQVRMQLEASRRLRLSALAEASRGDLQYAEALHGYGSARATTATATSVPVMDVISVANARAEARGDYGLSELERLQLLAHYAFNGPDFVARDDDPYARQQRVGGDLVYERHTWHDTLARLGLGLERVDYSTGARFDVAAPSTTFERSLPERDGALRLTAGMTLAQGHGVAVSDQGEADTVVLWLPTTGVTLEGLLTRHRIVRLRGRLGASVQAYFDPVIAVLAPRGVAVAALTGDIPTIVSADFEVQATEPLPDWPGADRESAEALGRLVTARAAVRRALVDDNLFIELGGRWAARADPRTPTDGVLGAPSGDRQLTTVELAAYVTIIGGFGIWGP